MYCSRLRSRGRSKVAVISVIRCFYICCLVFLSFTVVSCASSKGGGHSKRGMTVREVSADDTQLQTSKKSVSEPFLSLRCDDNTSFDLYKQNDMKPLFLIVSQEYCPPCHTLYSYAKELRRRFGNQVSFAVLYYNDAAQHQVTGLPVCRLKKDAQHVLSGTDRFPRVLLFDDTGELTADITGLYPELYYYGLLREVISNARLRSIERRSASSATESEKTKSNN